MLRLGVIVAVLVTCSGCHWKAQAEDYKRKFVEETRHHYQTQMIKSAEIQLLTDENTRLKEENARLKAQIDQPRSAEAK